MAAIFGKINFFLKIGMATLQTYPVGIFMFCNFAKNSKIQNGRHFLRDKFFLKIDMVTVQRHPVGQKFGRNHSI